MPWPVSKILDHLSLVPLSRAIACQQDSGSLASSAVPHVMACQQDSGLFVTNSPASYKGLSTKLDHLSPIPLPHAMAFSNCELGHDPHMFSHK